MLTEAIETTYTEETSLPFIRGLILFISFAAMLTLMVAPWETPKLIPLGDLNDRTAGVAGTSASTPPAD